MLTLAEGDVALIDSHGEVVGTAVEVSMPLLEIAPGDAIDGALSFEPLSEVRGVSLRIDLGGAGDPVPLEIPLRTRHRAGSRTGPGPLRSEREARLSEASSGGEPCVDTEVREAVRLGVALAAHVLVLDRYEPRGELVAHADARAAGALSSPGSVR